MKMKDLTFNKAHDARLDLLMEGHPHARKGKMFGMPGYMVNGKLSFGVFQEGVIIKVGKKRAADLINDHDFAEPFEPMEGRVWKDWVFLNGDIDQFQDYYEEAIAYVLKETAS